MASFSNIWIMLSQYLAKEEYKLVILSYRDVYIILCNIIVPILLLADVNKLWQPS